MLLANYGISVLWYGKFLKITKEQIEHLEELEKDKDKIIPRVDPYCYKNFKEDYANKLSYV